MLLTLGERGVASSDGTPLARVGRFGNHDGQLEKAHSVAVDAGGSVYVGDITGARVQKFVPANPSKIPAGSAPWQQDSVCDC